MSDAQNERSGAPSSSDVPSPEQLALILFAFDEAGRSLAHQQAELDRLRERALSQLGFATAISTFILGTIFDNKVHRSIDFFLFMTLASALGLAALYVTAQVWSPVKDWRFKVGASFIVNSYANNPTMEAVSELAAFYDHARESNEVHLQKKRGQFRKATIASAMMVVWLVAALWVLV